MHDMIYLGAWHQQREELARQIAQERLARWLRPARPEPRRRISLTGRVWGRLVGRPQAAR